jgi:hypothetical protein
MTHYTSRTWQDQWACRDIQSCITLFDMGKRFIIVVKVVVIEWGLVLADRGDGPMR